MKKFVFVLLIMLCVSCEEILIPAESSQPESTKTDTVKVEPPTTYQILDSVRLLPPIEYLNGSLWEVAVYYYIGNEIVRTDSINPIITGEISPKISIPSYYEKLKFSFKLVPSHSIYYLGKANCRRYSKDFYMLEKGKNLIIKIKNFCSMELSLSK